MWSCSVGLPRRKALNLPGFCDHAGRIVTQTLFWSNAFLALLVISPALAADAKFLGKSSCSSSGCHGGAAQNQNQSIVWSNQDAHSRASATLTTARSRRLAELLKISDPARDHRCTSCHEPWQNLNHVNISSAVSPVSEAVSCESCHGAAENYIRSHTRKDLTRDQKLLDGLRDLTRLYNRANGCVACHQVVDGQLLQAGHPELLFELDGQSASMPRHWQESPTNTHAATWLTGQAVALRELTWQLMEERKNGASSSRSFVQWQSALWVVSRTAPELVAFDTNAVASTEKLQMLRTTVEKVALSASALTGSKELEILRKLADDPSTFAGGEKGSADLAARAERLALGIDRLAYHLPKDRRSTVEKAIEGLFEQVQSRPDFSPERFTKALGDFKAALGKSN